MSDAPLLAGLTPALWQSLGLTMRLAAISTVILLAIALPLAGWLDRTRLKIAPWIEALVTLPIVLPPTVIGFYLLVGFGGGSWLGTGWQALFDSTLAFSFAGLVVGSVIYSLPFAVQPIQNAIREVDAALIEAGCALGARPRQVFWRVIVPAARNGILTGAALSFAHTMGEFGVVLMLGGNIPGATRVASIALYDETQLLNYPVAHSYALLLLAISFAMLMLIGLLRRGARQQARPKLR
ncbi:molybdate ABC transporter permease subunit [Nevskia sp.]|uniref:molybdate ABC transporter permease subunit n=1 Tax=Nevskia sp. TaxID=1929292 RepID=UPI0025DE667C|nr:molybdate ABC transporter permease subunit [Nevskia sp.]